MTVIELLRRQAQLKRELREVEQELCAHTGGTYDRLEWTWHGKACKQCHKVLERSSEGHIYPRALCDKCKGIQPGCGHTTAIVST